MRTHYEILERHMGVPLVWRTLCGASSTQRTRTRKNVTCKRCLKKLAEGKR